MLCIGINSYERRRKVLLDCLPQFLNDWSKIPPWVLFYSPILITTLIVFATKSWLFNITFENSIFTVTMLVIKSKTIFVRFRTKWQANLNLEIASVSARVWPIKWIFLDLKLQHVYMFIKVCNSIFMCFSPADYF